VARSALEWERMSEGRWYSFAAVKRRIPGSPRDLPEKLRQRCILYVENLVGITLHTEGVEKPVALETR
jgi:hypothetical protein